MALENVGEMPTIYYKVVAASLRAKQIQISSKRHVHFQKNNLASHLHVIWDGCT